MSTRFSAKTTNCGICLNLIEVEGLLNSCPHKFCHDCILAWAQVKKNQRENRCPLCKLRFSQVTRNSLRVEYTQKPLSVVSVVSTKDQHREPLQQEVPALIPEAHNLFRLDSDVFISL